MKYKVDAEHPEYVKLISGAALIPAEELYVDDEEDEEEDAEGRAQNEDDKDEAEGNK